MALSGLTFDPIMAYGKEYKLLSLKVTIGASGAVSSVDGKGWKSDGSEGVYPNNGTVTRSAEGTYDIVLPGTGSIHDVSLLSFAVEDGAVADVRVPLLAVTLSSRTIQIKTVTQADHSGAADPAVTDPTDGSVLHITLLVKNSNID